MKLISTWILLLFLTFTSFAQLQEVPELEAFVTDQTGTLNTRAISLLSNQLEVFEEEKGSQVVVLIVSSTQPETIEQYSWRVAEENEIGRKDVNDGVLLLIAKDDRKVRIEVGYGLEGAIPDAIAKRIIEEQIIPEFKLDNYYLGITNGVNAILAAIEGEELPNPVEQNYHNKEIKGTSGSVTGFQYFIIVFSFLPLIVLIELMKNKYGKWKGFVLGAVTGYVIMLILVPFYYASFIQGTVVIMMFLGTILGGGGGGTSGGRRYYSGYVGGYGGGGYSGGFGGGFSGGGGSFGGGGASGGW